LPKRPAAFEFEVIGFGSDRDASFLARQDLNCVVGQP